MFIYENGIAVDYECTRSHRNPEICAAVRQHMVDWWNDLPAQMKVRVGKRDRAFGADPDLHALSRMD